MLAGVKIALLSDCYLPRLGGIEVQVHDLARTLIARGHQVEAFTATWEPGQVRNQIDVIDGVRVHRLAIPLPGRIPVNPLAPRVLRERLLAGGFEVAHAHLGVVAPFAMDAVRVVTTLGMPTAVTWHSVTGSAEPVLRAAGYVGRWARRGAALSAVSHIAAAPIQRLAGDGHEVRVLPNGIEPSVWPVAHRTVDPGRLRIASAMRLARRKRPMQLLEMVRRARQAADDIRIEVEILGDGPWRGRMATWVREHDAGEWVHLPGRVARPELARRYAASDAYIAPSRLEAFGIAALEARTTGLPVIAPAESGVTEFVTDGVDGLIARGGDDALVEAIVRLAVDLPLRREITTHNETTPPAQTWAEVVARAEAEYARAQQLSRQQLGQQAKGAS